MIYILQSEHLNDISKEIIEPQAIRFMTAKKDLSSKTTMYDSMNIPERETDSFAHAELVIRELSSSVTHVRIQALPRI